MLKKVVFILEYEKAISDIEDLTDELTGYGVTVCIAADNISINDCFYIADSLYIPDCLYITDSPSINKCLSEHHLPVIIYIHENNRHLNFPAAKYIIEDIAEIEYDSLNLGYLRLTGKPWPILETKRLMVRESTVDDVDSFYDIYKDPSITLYMEDLYKDKNEEIAYIQEYIEKVYSFYGYGMWSVIEKTSGNIIGRAGISWREGYDIPELGFVIAVPYQRQGYAYEVCSAILEYGRSELSFDSFQALVMEGNEASKALCTKLGFVFVQKVEIDGKTYDRLVLRA